MEKKNINEVIANLSVEQLAGMIDHTFLKPFGTAENIEKLCAEARQYQFAMVAINPAEVETCVKLLEGSGVRVGAAIGFPLGQPLPRELPKLIRSSMSVLCRRDRQTL